MKFMRGLRLSDLSQTIQGGKRLVDEGVVGIQEMHGALIGIQQMPHEHPRLTFHRRLQIRGVVPFKNSTVWQHVAKAAEVEPGVEKGLDKDI